MNIQDWIIEECQPADFGDVRLNNRYNVLLNEFIDAPDKSIPTACRGWAETLAAYRFLHNKKVTPDKILEPHKQASLTRIQQEEVVLLPQDDRYRLYWQEEHDRYGLFICRK